MSRSTVISGTVRAVSKVRDGMLCQLQNGLRHSHAVRSLDLDFCDHRAAFKHKNLSELFRALVILRACGSNFLVDNCLKLFQMGRKVCGDRIVGSLLHPTIYAQFVAGFEERDVATTAQNLRKLGLRFMLTPTLEEDVGESSDKQAKYDRNLEELLHLAEMVRMHGGDQPCLQAKVTALLSADTLKVVSAAKENSGTPPVRMVEAIAEVMAGASATALDLPGISRIHQNNLFLAANRFRTLGTSASSKGLHLLVDAEWSYVNPACSLLTLAMMANFNRHSPAVGNTYQCYFNDIDKYIQEDVEISRGMGACFSAKVVRGAYLEKERLTVPERLCASHSETGKNYDRAIDLILNTVVCNQDKRCLLVIATHNEDSVKQAVRRLQELNIDPLAGHVAFAQIYGMAEQISMPLCRAGYTVYKATPTGPLAQVLPYLARRVAENRGVLQGARKERELLQKEIKFRLTAR
ncbi:hydroxyproline dehydrogenase-like [Bacillus rossius redtenbacheri]|uniref:hydroxyproline dehydrogenase-like n=1 Tax=Bacillus rossius redtenbacheri TaxID=93214 RepID=UPI002FDDF61C